MRKFRPYYTLLQRREFTEVATEKKTRWWCIEFGDYDRAVVEDELADYRDHDVKVKDLKIIMTSVRHEDVLAAVAVLNLQEENK